jgi:segregation and condensation protein A
MATMQTELQVEIHNGSDVIELVNSDATWRDLLLELVERNKLDPWNIDIIDIVDKYIDTVKKLKVLDLRVPANIILAVAILLRLKSNYISLHNYEEMGEAVGEGDQQRPSVIIDPLNFRLRLPPKRKVSLTELMSALDEAMRMKEAHLSYIAPSPYVPIHLENFDMEAETEKLLDIIRDNTDKSNMVTFSYLSRLSSIVDPLLGLFIPLLFLAHKDRVSIMQEKFFSEIIIALK